MTLVWHIIMISVHMPFAYICSQITMICCCCWCHCWNSNKLTSKRHFYFFREAVELCRTNTPDSPTAHHTISTRTVGAGLGFSTCKRSTVLLTADTGRGNTYKGNKIVMNTSMYTATFSVLCIQTYGKHLTDKSTQVLTQKKIIIVLLTFCV